MGKTRIVKKGGDKEKGGARSGARAPRRKLDRGILFVEATYNNTKVSFSDDKGNLVAWSTSGSHGFAGAKKGTPFAAAKVAEVVADKVMQMGVSNASVVVKGVGPGRESAVRAFAAKGITLDSIRDMTPVPFNGPRPKKARRI